MNDEIISRKLEVRSEPDWKSEVQARATQREQDRAAIVNADPLLSLKQAAEYCGKTAAALLLAIARGSLKFTHKTGGMGTGRRTKYFFSERNLQDYLALRTTRKSKRGVKAEKSSGYLSLLEDIIKHYGGDTVRAIAKRNGTKYHTVRNAALQLKRRGVRVGIAKKKPSLEVALRELRKQKPSLFV